MMTDYSPEISIILPSHNRANYVSLAIESCLTQSSQDFELIIVDDASQDDSVDIIKSYMSQDSRIKLIQNKSNKKLPASLNIGFKEASGEYFTWISDDNLFHKDALLMMKNYLDEHLDIGLVYADYTLINAKGDIGNRIYQEEPEFLPIRDCVGACFLYRKTVAEQVGNYNEAMFLIEDYEYWLRMGLATKFHHIQESLYFYRKHEFTLTNTRKEEIRQAKNLLKTTYSHKYNIPQSIKPIADLYTFFIGERDIWSILKCLKVIICNPSLTLGYIFKNLRRLQ